MGANTFTHTPCATGRLPGAVNPREGAFKRSGCATAHPPLKRPGPIEERCDLAENA